MNSIASAAVFFPEKTAVCQSSFQQVKPAASLVLTLSDGSERTVRVPIRVGRILNADIDELPSSVPKALDYVDALQDKSAYSYLVETLSRRDYSKKEIVAKLTGQGFSSTSIQSAVERAVDARFLDDSRFVAYYIDERIRRGWGRIKIEHELRRKGVEPKDIPGYPELFFDDQTDSSRAIDILSHRSIPASKPFEKLVRYLMSKGFSYSVARDAVRARLDEDS